MGKHHIGENQPLGRWLVTLYNDQSERLYTGMVTNTSPASAIETAMANIGAKNRARIGAAATPADLAEVASPPGDSGRPTDG